MITIAVPNAEVQDAIGDLSPHARTVIWDPKESEAPAGIRDEVRMVCLGHLVGGRKVYSRIGECPQLSVVQLPSAGFEHALPFVPDGVRLANARGVHDTRVAEMTLGLAIASQRRLPEFFAAQQRGSWEQNPFTPSLADCRALVVGYGSIGRAIGVRLRASEVEVEGVARSARIDEDGTTVHAVADLTDVVGGFDIVVIVTPYDDSTAQLIDAGVLAAMKDDALVINVGRGGVVDTEALTAEVLAGRLRCALDVTDPEPLPEGHALWSAPGAIITPHVAGFAQLTDSRYASLVRAQAESLASGGDGVNLVS